MSITCNELFLTCWWRNKYYSCCELFSQQKTEYGICLSFNSFTNAGTKLIDVSYYTENIT